MVFAPSPFTFLKMQLEGAGGSVDFGQPAFGEAPETLDAVDVDLALCERITLLGVRLDPQMLVIADIHEAGIPAPTITNDRGLQGHATPNKPFLCGLACILDDLSEDPAAALDNTKDGRLVGAAPDLPEPELTAGPGGSEPALIRCPASDCDAICRAGTSTVPRNWSLSPFW